MKRRCFAGGLLSVEVAGKDEREDPTKAKAKARNQ
jgi:hypothetical protein